VDASHGDDALGRVQGDEIKRRPSVQSRDLVAGHNAPMKLILAYLGVEVADAEFGQPVLSREIADDVDKQVDSAVAAGVSGGTDDHWHAKTARRDQHRLKIVRLPLQRAGRDIRTKRSRPDITRPGISADQVRFAVTAFTKAAGFDWRETEMSVWANNPQRMVGRTSELDRSGHTEVSSNYR